MVIGLLALLDAVAFAAAPGAPAGPAAFTVETWTTDRGLPQNSVIAMTQTRDGFLWLGTLNGLARFDGMRFTVFDENNTPGLESSRIVSLFEDRARNLWIGTETAGVVVMKRGQVTGLGIGEGSAGRRLVGACEDETGAVWLYMADGQLWRHWEGRSDAFAFGLARESAYRGITAEDAGPVWVGTDWGLAAVRGQPDPSSLELTADSSFAVGSRLDFVLARRQGGCWRLADGRVQQWQTRQLERDWGAYPWGSARVSAACEDRDGNLVVGTLGSGVFWYGPDGQVTSLSTNQGLSNSYILSLDADREGTLWVGTDGGGLNRVKRQLFSVVPLSQGLVVQSLCDDGQGGAWLGFNGNGAARWHTDRPEWFGPDQGLFNPVVRCLFRDVRGRVWAGTWGAGLFRFEAGRFQRMSGLDTGQQIIHAIHEDLQGQLWLGTQGGVVRWDPEGSQVFTTQEGLPANPARAMVSDTGGGLWIGTVGGGLCRFKNGRFESFRRQPDGLPSDDVSALCMDGQGVLWVGTFGRGLARLQGGRWTRYTTREGLASNSIGYLLEDGDSLWIGSTAGLMRVAKQSLNDVAQKTLRAVSCRTYRPADGLPTGECTSGSQPAACRAQDGTLWFPTIKGAAFVRPGGLQPNPHPPPVTIESIRFDDAPSTALVSLEEDRSPLDVPARVERFEIAFTSLNLGGAEHAQFRYCLRDHETGWIDAGNTRVARYSRVPPGEYRFQVTACNEDGVWNLAGASLTLRILPPFWRTWWFLALAVAALLAPIIAIVHYLSVQKLERQLERHRQHETLEKERGRIARDLHDQLGASMTQLSLLGEMAESDKNQPDEIEAHARQITRVARDTTRVLDEIVWAVNPSNDTLESLMTYVCKYAQDFLGVAGIRCRLEVPAQLPAAPLPPEVRHNVFLVCKEAVTNVVRHAAASEVSIRLQLQSRAFELEIRDNGRGLGGLDPEAAGRRNGLRNMRQRMQEAGGTCVIASAPAGGTVVRLTAPRVFILAASR